MASYNGLYRAQPARFEFGLSLIANEFLFKASAIPTTNTVWSNQDFILFVTSASTNSMAYFVDFAPGLFATNVVGRQLAWDRCFDACNADVHCIDRTCSKTPDTVTIVAGLHTSPETNSKWGVCPHYTADLTRYTRHGLCEPVGSAHIYWENGRWRVAAFRRIRAQARRGASLYPGSKPQVREGGFYNATHRYSLRLGCIQKRVKIAQTLPSPTSPDFPISALRSKALGSGRSHYRSQHYQDLYCETASAASDLMSKDRKMILTFETALPTGPKMSSLRLSFINHAIKYIQISGQTDSPDSKIS
ncbi:hypothetical protein BJ138DRAFT_1106652 [Hygrophoropsis aurantiaca]|uniref:Uncharacterized protein n=1 Tax=Hygrophoropsis aurantiaca TaxID=72124 RepID=A0ACB7ZVB6_9AGAM|nr:hypothetical protein BJ138DRAFT_1106652 [Hygrophoropsis aurantiaca]